MTRKVQILRNKLLSKHFEVFYIASNSTAYTNSALHATSIDYKSVNQHFSTSVDFKT